MMLTMARKAATWSVSTPFPIMHSSMLRTGYRKCSSVARSTVFRLLMESRSSGPGREASLTCRSYSRKNARTCQHGVRMGTVVLVLLSVTVGVSGGGIQELGAREGGLAHVPVVLPEERPHLPAKTNRV